MGIPITRLPTGLPGFTGSKYRGENPDSIGEVIVPTFDAEPFLQELAPMSIQDSVTSVNAVGPNRSYQGGVEMMLMEPGQAAIVHGISVRADAALGAGVELSGRPIIIKQAGTILAPVYQYHFPIGEPGYSYYGTGEQPLWGTGSTSRKYYLRYPDEIGFWCDHIFGGPINIRFNVWYSRFEL